MSRQQGTNGYRLGADIGGTFTDIILVAPDGAYWSKKVSSTPDDYARGIVEGVTELLSEVDVPAAGVQEVVHGTTVAINAVLEEKGAKTALITTRGFRDVLELRRLRVPQLYSLHYKPPTPLVPRWLRLTVAERIGADGATLEALDESDVRAAVQVIREAGVEAVAVCLLHSFSNPEHERRVGEILGAALPELSVSLSVDVLREIREYERTSTTVVNAYLRPVVQTYLETLRRDLDARGVTAPVRVMQSNGGVMSEGFAARNPVRMVESGPAAGVVAAHETAQTLGLLNVITFDMGGTTAKASVIEDGQRSWTTEHEIGSGIALSSRLVKGGGHAIKVPVIDLAEVGTGGGSIVRIDRGGALKVGPESAGAEPGPACYGHGGTEPTVTDANVVLGYINPGWLAGGAVRLDQRLATKTIRDNVAKPLGLELMEAAHGVFRLSNVTMGRAIKAVSTYRGRDPRDFTLLAFGGSGPVHAADLAASLGIGRVLVPPSPGLYSAAGLLLALPEHHFVQTFYRPTSEVPPEELAKTSQDIRRRAMEDLSREGYDASDFVWRWFADLRYSGQAFELTVPIPDDLENEGTAALVDRFHEEHLRTYGHRAEDEPVDIVNLRAVATAESAAARPNAAQRSDAGAGSHDRDVYFGGTRGLVRTPVVSRAHLTSTPSQGPLIVEEYDATTVVPPNCAAALDELDNIIIDVAGTI